MTFSEYKISLNGSEPAAEIDELLKALWYEHNGNWEKAHDIVESIQSAESAWVHAFLHRKEPDPVNAAYWYRKATQPFPKISLEAEWEQLCQALLLNT